MKRSNRHSTGHHNVSSLVGQGKKSKSSGDHRYNSYNTPTIVIDESSLLSNRESEQTANPALNEDIHPFSEFRRSTNDQQPSNISNSFDSYTVLSELRTISSHVTDLNECIQQQREDREKTEDWQFIAMVIDRFFLIIFIIFITILVLKGFFLIPNSSKL